MGPYDAIIKQMLMQLKAKADQLGIDLDNAEITFEGNTPVVSGDVYSEEDLEKLSDFIELTASNMKMKATNNIQVVDEDDEDEEDDEDDEEDDEDDEDQEYTVQKGDSFWKIAEEFYGDGTKHKIISEYNDTEHLHPGDVIIVPSLQSYIGGEKLQVILTVIGYSTGSIDGVVGAKTQSALRQFQADSDLDKTGKVDDDTKDALRAAFYDAEEIPDKCLQIILRDLDYEVGTIDGVVGSKTKAALREFQGDNDLDETGKLDEDTISTLVESYA